MTRPRRALARGNGPVHPDGTARGRFGAPRAPAEFETPGAVQLLRAAAGPRAPRSTDPRWGPRGELGEGAARGGYAVSDALARAPKPKPGRLRPAIPGGLRGPIAPPLPPPLATRAPVEGSPYTMWPVPGFTELNKKDNAEEGRGHFGAGRGRPGARRPHTGIDIQAAVGSQVVAGADGVVVETEPNGGFGYMVVIQHPGGSRTRYAHLEARDRPKIGQRVKAGAPIGRVGRSGNVPKEADAHLHLEVRDRNGDPVDPERYFPDRRSR